jgi:hypothetical protein
VDDDVLGDVLVDHAPVVRVVVVERLDVAADQLLVRFGRHLAPFLAGSVGRLLLELVVARLVAAPKAA